MLAVRNRAIDGRGLSPPRSAALLAAPGSSHASHYVMGRCCLLFNGTRSAPRNWTRFAAQYLARSLPCERFTSPLAGRRASLGVGAVGYSLPRGGLSPPILCQLNWRTPLGVNTGKAQVEQKISASPPNSRHLSGHRRAPLRANAQSRCAPARCAGARAERPVAS